MNIEGKMILEEGKLWPTMEYQAKAVAAQTRPRP
jgi:hypothetical protein